MPGIARRQTTRTLASSHAAVSSTASTASSTTGGGALSAELSSGAWGFCPTFHGESVLMTVLVTSPRACRRSDTACDKRPQPGEREPNTVHYDVRDGEAGGGGGDLGPEPYILSFPCCKLRILL